MRCPYCGHHDLKVVDSRDSEVGEAIRRRREGLQCGQRFTTYERIETVPFFVTKKDGRREDFDPHKLFTGLKKATEDRKSTRLNSSHQIISYAVFCLKKNSVASKA